MVLGSMVKVTPLAFSELTVLSMSFTVRSICSRPYRGFPVLDAW